VGVSFTVISLNPDSRRAEMLAEAQAWPWFEMFTSSARRPIAMARISEDLPGAITPLVTRVWTISKPAGASWSCGLPEGVQAGGNDQGRGR